MSADRRVLVVGTLALDTVETSAGRVEDVVGGSAPYFAAAAGLLAPVDLVGVAGHDYPVRDLRFLEERGVDLSGIERVDGPSFRWSVRYRGSERETLDTNRGVTLGTVPRVPASMRRPWALCMGSTDPAVQRAVLDQVNGAEVVALDTMGHWIESRRTELEVLLGRVNLLLVNEAEAAFLGANADLAEAAAALRARGPGWVVVKRGARGACAFGPGGRLDVAARSVTRVVDPTGAGDAFAGGLMGSLARRGRLDRAVMQEALAIAARTAALAVSSFSLESLADADEEEFRSGA